ncbi:hypothetical protein [Nonomuraea sp. SYSU D8015]|uniref:hypothetical protein n=1 Tax=Nonomuraea sp. SYSU D8015 TaxID=2593644 RepID=UPI001CB75132|nr:hypothetical protein [Nonomuraea sp. SYSU D8015]
MIITITIAPDTRGIHGASGNIRTSVEHTASFVQTSATDFAAFSKSRKLDVGVDVGDGDGDGVTSSNTE